MRIPLILAALAACSTASGDDQPPQPVRLDKPASVRFHMRRHFDDLRTVEQMLVHGQLDDAKARAFLLTKPVSDPGIAPWAADVDRVTNAARSLVAAPGIDEALRREARLAGACASCHARTREQPIFAAPPATPRDQANAASAMARHQWAVDRLWEGMVSGSYRPWRDGLDVIAGTPLPFSPATEGPALGERLQELARRALVLQRDGTETLDERARLYGEMLVTCSACHAKPTARKP